MLSKFSGSKQDQQFVLLLVVFARYFRDFSLSSSFMGSVAIDLGMPISCFEQVGISS